MKSNSIIRRAARPESRLPSVAAAPSAPPASAALAEWTTPHPAAELGIRSGSAFVPVDRMTIVAITRDYRRRFSANGEQAFRDAITAARLIMGIRLKNDFPGAEVSMHILLPNADIGIVVKRTGSDAYVNDQRLLQERFDDACRDLAGIMGI